MSSELKAIDKKRARFQATVESFGTSRWGECSQPTTPSMLCQTIDSAFLSVSSEKF